MGILRGTNRDIRSDQRELHRHSRGTEGGGGAHPHPSHTTVAPRRSDPREGTTEGECETQPRLCRKRDGADSGVKMQVECSTCKQMQTTTTGMQHDPTCTHCQTCNISDKATQCTCWKEQLTGSHKGMHTPYRPAAIHQQGTLTKHPPHGRRRGRCSMTKPKQCKPGHLETQAGGTSTPDSRQG